MTFNNEPTLWISFIKSLIYLGVLFGLHLTAEQIAGMLVVAESFAALLIRSQVVPTSKL